jgi:phosphatidylglycerol lysyltransferase
VHAPAILGASLLTIAIWVLHRELGRITYAELSVEIATLPGWRIASSLAFTALSFLALAGYEQSALRLIGKPQLWRRAWLAAFVAQSMAHSTGFASVVGIGLRSRLYAASGLALRDVASIQLLCSMTFVLGVMTLGGIALVAEPAVASAVVPLPLAAWRMLGAGLLIGVVAFGGWGVRYGAKGIDLRGSRLALPDTKALLALALLAAADLGAAAGALYVLLPDLAVSYVAFLGMFTVAVVIGVASSVPGALGVLESTLLLMLQPSIEQVPATVGALVVFRVVYYLVPLLAGACVFGLLEWRQSAVLRRTFSSVLRAVSPIAPLLFGMLTFAAGVVLLVSGSLPAEPQRLRAIAELLPQSLIELSHFTGSLAGTALLLLASGLRRRVAAAWAMAAALLALGIIASLLKGLDYEEALLLAVVLATLALSRREFFRSASLFAEGPSLPWTVAIAAVFAAIVWLVGFAYQHVEYADELWWQVALHADAPRSMRAALGSAVLLGAFALWRLLGPARARPQLPSARELDAAQAVVARGTSSNDWLALTGDKALLFSEARDAFIMYGVIGRSWIAMGEPIGARSKWPELIWRFHELASRNGARTVFYEVPSRALPLFLDVGLGVMKLGETARVDLATFDLEGKKRAKLRHAHNHACKEGARFKVLSPEQSRTLLDRLEEVSLEWLLWHNTREKRFSLGFFSRDYVARTPVAVVTIQDRIVAFANLWLAGDGSACSPDLMRFGADAPKSAMEFLLIETMLWAKACGCRWYDLGMAPLTGLPAHPLAPLASKLGRLLYQRGGKFYNFAGLRVFKDKFDPVWEPVYMLYSSRSPARALADVAALIGGGWLGVIAK